jgi:urease accessory protein
VSRTQLEVCRDPSGGRARLLVRTDGPRGRGHLGVRVLSTGTDRVRVALLAEGALLVAGDDVSLGMRVGPGVRLDIVEPAGTVAFDMRGGSARWTVDIEVQDAGELFWRSEPLVVATGAVVDREVALALSGSGCAVLREVLVLGRVREAGGLLRQRFRASVDGRPLLAEDLVLDGDRPRVGVVGPRRVVDSVAVLGRRPTEPCPPGAHRLDLDGAGTLLRHLGADTHTSPLDPFWAGLVSAPVSEAVPA